MMEIMQFIITSLPSLNQSYEEATKDSKFVIWKILIFKLNYSLFRDTSLKLQLLLLKTVQKVCCDFNFLLLFFMIVLKILDILPGSSQVCFSSLLIFD